MSQKSLSTGALVLGGDLGGTSTRILVADTSGRVAGRGLAGGGNPTAHPDSAAGALAAALADALAGLDPAAVGTAVIGAAGGGALRHPDVRARFDAVWAAAGLRCPPSYVPDLLVAFTSGTPAPDGTVLIAGTGAAAGDIRDHVLTRTADAHGWLLGDDGSGFWLGREAVRATLRAIDAGEPLGPLGEAVVRTVLGPPPDAGNGRPELGDTRDALIGTIMGRPPVRLAELARLVSDAYDAGDPAASSIAERAARLLSGTVRRVRPPGTSGPLVLAGSVAGEASPVGRLLRQIFSRTDAEVLSARDGLGGATWLALRALDPALATPEAHSRLVS
jgi:N-acetylglucosamine kinase-like BadF-type ATPase